MVSRRYRALFPGEYELELEKPSRGPPKVTKPPQEPCSTAERVSAIVLAPNERCLDSRSAEEACRNTAKKLDVQFTVRARFYIFTIEKVLFHRIMIYFISSQKWMTSPPGGVST